jgi:hypothetical protein
MVHREQAVQTVALVQAEIQAQAVQMVALVQQELMARVVHQEKMEEQRQVLDIGSMMLVMQDKLLDISKHLVLHPIL